MPVVLETAEERFKDFAQGVTGMTNSEDLGELVKQMLTAIHEEGQRSAKYRIHPLVYGNLVVIAGLIFSSGVLYQRVNEIDRWKSSMQTLETVAPKVEAIQQEVTRLSDRLDRYLDGQTRK